MTAPLGRVIAWKTGGAAQATVAGEEIVAWSHPSIPEPDASTLATWRGEHDAYEAGRAYRDERAAAYAGLVPGVDGLGAEPGFIPTIGDVLDDIIAQIEANRIAAGADSTPEFAQILTARAAIKTVFPKPE